MNSKLQIKTLLAQQDKTIKWLVERIAERTGKKYSQQAFSNKLNASRLRYDEVLLIAEILNYDILFVEKS